MFSASIRGNSRRPAQSPPIQNAAGYRSSVAPSINPAERAVDGPRPYAQSPELCVRQQAQLPREVQQELKIADFSRQAWSGHIDHITGYGFVLSPTTCFVWRSPTATSDAFSTTCYIFPAPQAEVQGTISYDALPVATLVSNGVSQEPGLIVGSATGEIRFWDNISTGLSGADNYHSVLLPLLDGERLSSLYSCEKAVYIVTTTFGRLFRLGIFTSEGRPQITFSLFTKPQSVFSRLLFRGQEQATQREGMTTLVMGEGNMRDGQDVWVVTQTHLQKWQMSLDRGEQRMSEVNIQDILKTHNYGDANKPAFVDGHSAFETATDIEILDVAVLPDKRIVILIAFDPPTSATAPSRSYAVAHLSPNIDGMFVEDMQILPYGKDADVRPATSPRMKLLDNGSAAFVQFGDAVTVLSLGKGTTFKETLTLKSKWDRFLGFGITKSENPLETSNVVVLSASKGILKWAINKRNIKEFTPEAPTNQLKSTLEQAVFLGSLKDNPFLFTISSRKDGSLGDAALALSSEILSSSSRYLNKSSIEVAAQLKDRLQNLRSLITFINENGVSGNLSVSERKRLSVHAEKLSATGAIWSMYCSDPRRFQFLSQVIETYLAGISAILTHEDPLRSFCRSHVDALDKLLIELACNQSSRDAQRLPAINRIMLCVYDSVIRHRADSAPLYNIPADNHNDPLWTSDPTQLSIIYDMFMSIARLLSERMKHIGPHAMDESANKDIAELRMQLRDTAYVVFYVFKEREDYLKAKALDENDRDLRLFQERFAHVRTEVLPPLVQRKWVDEAFKLAEKYRDFRLLTELSTNALHGSNAKIQHYIGEYGDPFSFELFGWYEESGNLKDLLTLDDQHNDAVSRYLEAKANPRISWVHSLRIQKPQSAAEALAQESAGEENLQSKKVMLSIGKLCVLSTISPKGITEEQKGEVLYYDELLDLVSVQERLTQQFRDILAQHPQTNPSVQDVDRITAVCASRLSEARPAFYNHFRRLARTVLQGKVLSAEELIDVLTLNEERSINGFMEALEVLIRVYGSDDERTTTPLQAIWRRAMIHDDWQTLRNVPNVTDDQAKDLLTQTALFDLMRGCVNSQTLTADWWQRPDEVLSIPTKTELVARFPQFSDRQIEDMLADYESERDLLDSYFDPPVDISACYDTIARLVDGEEEDEVEAEMEE